MPRPATEEKPRPVCRYYNVTRHGCLAGDKCHYIHGDPAIQKYAPYEEAKTCRFFEQGYCRRGNECWFRHVTPGGEEGSKEFAVGEACADVSCGICFEERPELYGLLSACSHAFCLNCIRQWRDPVKKGSDLTYKGVHKTCPMCRTRTRYVVPSSRFFAQDDPGKADAVAAYRASMARVPCRHFANSKANKPFCPFGRDCFYQHLNADGTAYVFKSGVDVMMAKWRRRTAAGPASSNSAPFDVLRLVASIATETDRARREQIVEEEVRAGGMDTAEALRTVDWLMGMLRRWGGGGSGDGDGGEGGAQGDTNPGTAANADGEMRTRLAAEEVQRFADALGEGAWAALWPPASGIARMLVEAAELEGVGEG